MVMQRANSGGVSWRLVTLAVGSVAALGPLRAEAQRYLPMPDRDHPRLKYADSLESLNDRCIVRKAKLNLKMRPVYVNGQPVGFC